MAIKKPCFLGDGLVRPTSCRVGRLDSSPTKQGAHFNKTDNQSVRTCYINFPSKPRRPNGQFPGPRHERPSERRRRKDRLRCFQPKSGGEVALLAEPLTVTLFINRPSISTAA